MCLSWSFKTSIYSKHVKQAKHVIIASPACDVSQARENEASQAREVIQVVWTADMEAETRNSYSNHK